MADLVNFQNFAKLKNTSIEFNDITLIAGKPGLGKSYIMKFMYAINKSFDLLAKDIIFYHKIMNEQVNEYMNLVETTKEKKPKTIQDAKKIEEKINKLSEKAQETYNEINSNTFKNKLNKKRRIYLKNLLESMFKSIGQISNNFTIKSDTEGLYIEFKNEEIKKFLFDSSFNEKYIEKEPILVYKDFSMYEKQFQHEPIFVETPLILEFKSFMKRDKGKTPYHIESLLNILDTDYSFPDEEQAKFIESFKEKSKLIINGDIVSNGDSFIFAKSNKKNYDILNTSSGIKSIGLLQYLVTNKALKKGSILFWEEPEVHLHPDWQLKMIDLFIELMKAGVKIVFSTHSPYIVDYLNAISKKNALREKVSFNVLQEEDGVVNNYILNDNNWEKLQKELMNSFEDILWQYL